jgi:hypothetical protein
VKHNAASERSRIWRSLLSRLPPDFTFLHFTLLADAPKVAAALMKNRADISQEVEEYPDLMPPCLILPTFFASSPKEFHSEYLLVSAQKFFLPLHPSTDSNCLISCCQNISAHSYFDQAQHFPAVPMIKYSILRFPSAVRLPWGGDLRQCNSFCTRHNYLPWRFSKQNRDIIGRSHSQVGNG